MLMSGQKELILYSTDACHLCEQSLFILKNIPQLVDIRLVVVDISESKTLFEQFGERIPVIKLKGQTRDLGWPSSALDVKQYLGSVGLMLGKEK